MLKKHNKSIAFLSALAMTLTLLLYLPVNTYKGADYGTTAVADETTADNNGFLDDGTYQPAVWNESENYYEISNTGQLYWFAELVNGTLDGTDQDRTANAVLTQDIVMNKNVLSSDLEIAGFKNWIPIGQTDKMSYQGTFDGQNHTISGVYSVTTFSPPVYYYHGFFGYVDADGVVKNLGIVESYFSGIVGSGSIVGQNRGLIENCFAECEISNYVTSNNSYSGGICAYNSRGTIRKCYSFCKITAIAESSSDFGLISGGICGNNGFGVIENCYSGSIISAGNDSKHNYGYLGEIAGNSYQGSVSYCYGVGGRMTGNNKENYIAGVVGSGNKPTITNCYFNSNEYSGNVSGASGTPVNSSGKTAAEFSNGTVKELLQGDQEEQIWSQSDDDIIPTLNGEKVYKWNDCQGNVVYSLKERYDDGHCYKNGFCDICEGYQPAVYNEEKDCYEISNAGQLYWFADQVNNRGNKTINGVLTADIKIQNIYFGNNAYTYRAWTPIGTASSQYAGTFDGQNHTVSGLYYNDTTVKNSFAGLFGYGNGCTVKNVGVKESYFKGYSYIGSIIAYATNNAKIEKCYGNQNYIKGSNNIVGGICGHNSNSTVNNCYYYGPGSSIRGDETIDFNIITGYKYVGGIVGCNEGTVSNCYNSCDIYASTYQGGITGSGLNGKNEKNIVINCYYNNNETIGYTGNLYYNAITDEKNTYGKTSNQFSKGEVTYLLQQGQETQDEIIWGQNVDRTSNLSQYYPVLYGKKVNKAVLCNVYTNDTDRLDSHIDDNLDLVCDRCNADLRTNTHLAGYSLTLDGSIGVNFYMIINSAYANKDTYMKFTLANGDNPTVVNFENATVETVEVDGASIECYVFQCHVDISEMTMGITAQLFADETALTEEYDFVVQDYAKFILENFDDNETLCNLVNSMLVYGTKAQVYFDEFTNNYADSILDLDDDSAVKQNPYYEYTDLSDYAPQISNNENMGKFTSYYLNLNSVTTLRVRFKFNNDILGYKQPTFMIDGETLTTSVGDSYYYKSGDNTYTIVVDNIYAHNLGQSYKIYASGDGRYAQGENISPLSYVYSILYSYQTADDYDSSQQNDTLNLVNSLYQYYTYANAYYQSINSQTEG